MRAVLQRVKTARVDVDGQCVGKIDVGLMVLACAMRDDTSGDLEPIIRKIAELRLFPDDDGRMSRSLEEVGGAVLLVSQFTLAGDCRKGRRPSFARALEPVRAAELVDELALGLRERGLPVETGRFGAMMDVSLTNWGPVTVMLDSRKEF